MARYSADQIYAFAIAAGFDPDAATTMTAISLAESGGSTTAHATHGEDSRGLWQINARSSPGLAAKYDLWDPRQNAQAAFEISHGGRDVSPWTTTHRLSSASYLRFRADAERAAHAHGYSGNLGNWTGTAGYGHPLPASGRAGATPAPNDVPQAHEVPTLGDRAVDLHQTGAPALPVVDEFHGVAVSSGHDENSVRTAASKGSGEALPIVSDFHGVEVRMGGPRGLAANATATHAAPSSGGDVGWQAKRDRFVEAAVAQAGDRYIYGATASLTDPNPTTFDCSELTRWASHQAGVDIPDGAWAQYKYLEKRGLAIPVDQAKHTKGALLFYFAGPHTGTSGGPLKQHVAISLGNEMTIEAKGSKYGVGEFVAGQRFNFAAVIPQLSAPPGQVIEAAVVTDDHTDHGAARPQGAALIDTPPPADATRAQAVASTQADPLRADLGTAAATQSGAAPQSAFAQSLETVLAQTTLPGEHHDEGSTNQEAGQATVVAEHPATTSSDTPRSGEYTAIPVDNVFGDPSGHGTHDDGSTELVGDHLGNDSGQTDAEGDHSGH